MCYEQDTANDIYQADRDRRCYRYHGSTARYVKNGLGEEVVAKVAKDQIGYPTVTF